MRHGDADRNHDVLRGLDWDLLADGLGHNLAPWLVVRGGVVRGGVVAVVGGGPPPPAVVGVGYRGVADPLVHRLALGLVVQLDNSLTIMILGVLLTS